MAQASGDRLRSIRVLVPTNRNIYRALSYGMVVDFEDSVAELSDVDLLPTPLPSRRARLEAWRRRRKLRPVDPPRSRYDVCLFVAMEPQWVPTLGFVKSLRSRVNRVVVYLYDAWLADLDSLRRHRKTWSLVDDVFISFTHSLDAYREALECRVHYLPQAIHERWFRPYRVDRPIDVLSIGRRRHEVHQRLLEIARRDDLFYFFQTASVPETDSLVENQELLGRLCERARVHVSWSVEATNPARAEGAAPITARWFESAASAAAVIGSAPQSEEFRRLFPYEDFVTDIDPGDPADVDRALAEGFATQADAERIALAEHVLQAHTWKARWREIVETCGI